MGAMSAGDVVDMARTDAYDTAAGFSADTDLLPALEAAVDIDKRAETATSPPKPNRPFDDAPASSNGSRPRP